MAELESGVKSNAEAEGAANTNTEENPALSARLPLTCNLFALSIATFVVHIGFFFTRNMPVGIIRLQDILTMLNPLVLVPLFYRGALIDPHHARASRPPLVQQILFLLAVVIYVHGDGMHLAANAINRFDESIVDTTAKNVVILYDEQLGHYYPYTGFLLLHAIMILRQIQWSFADQAFAGCASLFGIVLAGILHGFTLFITFVEGRFAIPALVYFLVVVVFLLVSQRQRLRHDPVTLFSVVYSTMGLALLAVWGIWQQGFPEFTAAGLI